MNKDKYTCKLFWAIHEKDLGGATRALEAGADVNGKVQKVENAVMSQTLHGCQKAAKWMLRIFLSHERCNWEEKKQPPRWCRYTPLFHALSTEQYDIAHVLLQYEEMNSNTTLDPTRFNSSKTEDENALIMAVNKGEAAAEIIATLLQRGADIDLRHEFYSRTLKRGAGLALAWAIMRSGRGDLLNGSMNKDGDTMLHVALLYKDLGVARLLLQSPCINHEVANLHGIRPMHVACEWDSCLEIAKMLADRGTDIHAASDYFGWTPLCFAASGGAEAIARWLVTEGADVDVVTSDEKTPLYISLESRSYRVTRLLLMEGANPNVQSSMNKPLHYAVKYCHFTFAKLLLEHGAEINATDNMGRTAMSNAREYTNGGYMLQMLVENGADINAADNAGETRLHLAARWRSLDDCDFLLSHGADGHQKDSAGKSAFDQIHRHMLKKAIARFREDRLQNIVQLLVKHKGLNATSSSEIGRLLSEAFWRGRIDMLRMLLRSGADPNALDADGLPPIFSTPKAPLVAAQLLISAGANVNVVDERGRTPLFRASRAGRADVVLLLMTSGAVVNISDKKGKKPLTAARVSPVLFCLLAGAPPPVRVFDRASLLGAMTSYIVQQQINIFAKRGAMGSLIENSVARNDLDLIFTVLSAFVSVAGEL